jgi:hypothetical protein
MNCRSDEDRSTFAELLEISQQFEAGLVTMQEALLLAYGKGAQFGRNAPARIVRVGGNGNYETELKSDGT